MILPFIPPTSWHRLSVAVLLSSTPDADGWRDVDERLVREAALSLSGEAFRQVLVGWVDAGAVEMRRSDGVLSLLPLEHSLWTVASTLAGAQS